MFQQLRQATRRRCRACSKVKIQQNITTPAFSYCVFICFSSIHETQLVLASPIKTPTPYGGRLTWALPGGNLLYVHIKDKNKIRNKKRWSQVMYMYYLLGYQLLGNNDASFYTSGNQAEVGRASRVPMTTNVRNGAGNIARRSKIFRSMNHIQRAQVRK